MIRAATIDAATVVSRRFTSPPIRSRRRRGAGGFGRGSWHARRVPSAPRSGRLRSVGFGPWAPRRRRPGLPRLALALALAAGGPGCGAVDFINEIDDPGLDLARMEADIRSEVQRDLERDTRETRASVASVGRVRCRQQSEAQATCSARVSRPRGGRRLRRIAVSIDPETGAYRWEYVR